jgi:3-oxoacyl-[acyl-carrier protein] reductase
MNLKIKNRIALVTGGATGIGKAVSLELAKEGAIVVVTSRNNKNINNIVKELRKFNSNCFGIQTDITKKNQPNNIVNKIFKRFKKIDIVVNNVGDTLNIKNPYCGVEDWIKLFNLILGVAIRINNLVIPRMKKNRWGRIVNITAGAAMENSGPVPYCSLKSAFNAYSRSMARVLATEKTNIVMSAVLPGLVLTERGHWSKVLKNNPAHARKYLKERTTLKRFGTPDEISPIVTLMCSDLASFCIGSSIPVEGGQARHFFQRISDY